MCVSRAFIMCMIVRQLFVSCLWPRRLTTDRGDALQMLRNHVFSQAMHCACSLLENRDRLVESVKGGLDSAKELMPPLGGEATSQQVLRRCFPARLQHAGGSGAES
jgi:hypothetical protein